MAARETPMPPVDAGSVLVRLIRPHTHRGLYYRASPDAPVALAVAADTAEWLATHGVIAPRDDEAALALWQAQGGEPAGGEA